MLVDGNSLTYRAFFALPTDLSTASGQVTNAVFGFTSMLINLMRDHGSGRVAVAFDRPEPTFRHEQVESYKANRQAAPDILRQQMGLVRQVIETLGIRTLELPGYEADDIIATLATQGRDAGALAYLVKPFEKNELIPAVEVALGRFNEMKALAAQTASLEEQLETRKVVDRAKGILMDKHAMAEAEAFSFIQKRAMGERITMRVVAERVIAGDIRPGS